jgi:tetratricopeptide (TPR) repeat protein
MSLPTRLLVYLLLLFPLGLAGQPATDYFDKAVEAEEKKDYTGAIVHYTMAISKDARFVDAFFNRGWCYSFTGRNNEAARDFTKLIEIDKNYPNAYSGRAYARFQLGYYTEAVTDYLQEIKANRGAEMHACHNGLGAAYEKLQQYDKALEHYERAINLSPNYKTAINNKTQLMQLMASQQRKKKDSKEKILTAKEYYQLGYDAGGRDDYATAISFFDRAIEIDRTMKLAYDNRGWAKTMLGRHREALTDLNQSLELGMSKWTYNQRGQVKIKLSDPQGALNDFEQALRIDADYAPAKAGKDAAISALKVTTQVDVKPPVITILSPIPNRGLEIVTMDQEVTVVGKATDESGVRSVTINGVPARLSVSGDFDAKVKVGTKATRVFVIATDFKNNATTKEINIGTGKPTTTPSPGPNPDVVNVSGMGKSYALLIATDDYKDVGWSKLNNPIADAKALQSELGEHYGFETELLTNPSKAQIIAKLNDYSKKNYQSNDQLFIFVAGHGYFDDEYKEGFVVPADGKRDEDPFTAYLPHFQMRRLVNKINCKHTFLVMDVCFGGTIDPVLAKRGAPKAENVSTMELITRKMRFQTRRYLTSGGKEYVSDGQAGKHSPFVRNLLEALRTYGGGDKILTIDDILPYFQRLSPQPRYGELDDNEPGSDFIFLAK